MKRTLLIILFSAACVNAMAQSLPFLLPSTDARSFAMASVATENLSAANVLSGKNAELRASYIGYQSSDPWDKLVSFKCYGNSGPISVGVFGRLHQGREYEKFDNRALSAGFFTPAENVFGANLAFALPCNLSFGASAAMITSRLAESAIAKAVSYDLSAAYSIGGLTVEAGARNLGKDVAYGEYSYPLPSLAVAGASYRVGGFNAKAEFGYFFAGSYTAGIGVEQTFWKIISLRAGYHYGDDAHVPTYASAGLGLQFKGVSVDCTYIPKMGPRASMLIYGLGFSF